MAGRVNNNILKWAQILSDALADKCCSQQLLDDIVHKFRFSFNCLYDDAMQAAYVDTGLTLEQKCDKIVCMMLSRSLREEALDKIDE